MCISRFDFLPRSYTIPFYRFLEPISGCLEATVERQTPTLDDIECDA